MPPLRYACLAVAILAGVPASRAAADSFFIQEFQVEGARLLRPVEVESAVYSFLGPDRTAADVEGARAALETAYHELGFQTVSVQVPVQSTAGGIIRLAVVSVPVGRLRVRGAVYSSPRRIKALAPSLAEGKVIDFERVPKDILALNQLPDRTVTPSIRPGVEPGTVDVNLEVKEKQPVHASLELNNRAGPATKPLRVNGAFSDTNLAQSGDAAGISFQISPQDVRQVKVLSAYYLARFRQAQGIGFMITGTRQDSKVSTLGDTAVAGRGETLGLHANFALPADTGFVQSASAGIDYKHFNQSIQLGGAASGSAASETPITYFPIGAAYSAGWHQPHATTEFNGSATFSLRQLGGGGTQFENNRYRADANFAYLRADLSRTQDLPAGFQGYAQVQGQISDQPLVNSEELAGGGMGTVRGYLEAEAVGDDGLFGTVELRSPQLIGLLHRRQGSWRVFGFCDGGRLKVLDSLAGQTAVSNFASFGVGTRLQIDHFDGVVDAAFPRTDVGETTRGSMRVTFRAALDY